MEAISLYEKREQLKRVLQSRHFAKARKKSRFLDFVCEQAFLGNSEKLNEYLIGIEIYERGADFNPQEDAIVRVQAHEIRRSLKDYYEDEGKDDPFRIDLPPGHYVPIFSKQGDLSSSARQPLEQTPAELAAKTSARRFRLLALSLAFVCAGLVLMLAWQGSVARNAAPNSRSQALPREMLWFWQPFLPPAGPPLIVIPNHPLLRAAHEGDSRATLAQGHVIPKDKLPEFRDTIHYRELEAFHFVPSTTDFTAVGETLGLLSLFELFSQARQPVHVKASRLVDFEAIKQGNAILLGGNQPWSGRVFLYPNGFWFRRGVIANKVPRPSELAVYRPEFDPITNVLRRDYALVLMLPNEKADNRILLIYGIYTQGSQAAIEYITSADRLRELRSRLMAESPDRSRLPQYFQVLLETTVENYVPGKASVVAVRVIPQAAQGAQPE